MNEKIPTIDIFLRDYKSALAELIPTLSYLSGFDKTEELFDTPIISNEEEFITSQSDWLLLLPRLSDFREFLFFKPWWVPIGLKEYGYYVDLSQPNFQVIDASFWSSQPYYWYKTVMFEEITDLISLIKSEEDIQNFLNNFSHTRYLRSSSALKEWTTLLKTGQI